MKLKTVRYKFMIHYGCSELVHDYITNSVDNDVWFYVYIQTFRFPYGAVLDNVKNSPPQA